MKSFPYRIGLGFDIHRLARGRKCVLGGVKIPFQKGPEGHSDGDAVLHALADALLGAAGLDDLGTLFPDSDPKYSGAKSSVLMEEVIGRVRTAGFQPVNVDLVVIAEEPKLRPHRAKIRSNIAKLLNLPVSCVNLKGKTAERIGKIGKGEAIAVHAVAMIVSRKAF